MHVLKKIHTRNLITKKNSCGSLMSVAFAALQLRDVVSKFSRVETNAAICQELKVHCQLFFNTCSLLMKAVDPTVWTVRLSREFGFGLGINTMKGREA